MKIQTQHKASRREMTKIMAEINEIETKKKKNTKNQQNKKLDL
jgi:hypothetical protein